MKKSHIGLILACICVLALATAACSGAKEAPVTDVTVTDAGFGDEAMIGNPISLERSGTTLLVLDTKGSHLFHLFDISSGDYLGQACKRGQGPGEMAGVALASACPPADGALGSYIITQPEAGRVWRLDVGPDSIRPLTLLADSVSDAWELMQMPDGCFIGTNGYVEWPELYTVYSPDGRVARRGGRRHVPSEHASLSPVDITAAYQYSLVPSPAWRHLFAMGNGENAMIYEMQADSLVLTHEITGPGFKHTFDGEGHYRGATDESLIGFISAAATDSLVYVLSSDRTFADDNGWMSREIRAYDWHGDLRATLRPDKTLRLITPPDASGRIYAISEDGTDPRIVTIQIPRS